MDVFNPSTKITTTVNTLSTSGPSLVSYRGTMRMAWQGMTSRDSDHGRSRIMPPLLHVMNVYPFPGSKSHHVTNLQEISLYRPALTQLSLPIICWIEYGNNSINYGYFDVGLNMLDSKHMSIETSSSAPAATAYHFERIDHRHIAWKGSNNDHLNVAELSVGKVVID
jgi:hypothetical protein